MPQAARRALLDHFTWFFVVAQPLIRGMPEQAVMSPLREAHLGDFCRPQPFEGGHLFGGDPLAEMAGLARRQVSEGAPFGSQSSKRFHESLTRGWIQSLPDLAGEHQFTILIIPHQERRKGIALRFESANDELLRQVEFQLP